MQKQDYLMAQIEQLGKVLNQILLAFKEDKIQDSVESSINDANKKFLTQTNIDFNKILELENKELSIYLEDKIMSAHHIDIIIDYFLEIVNTDYLNNENKILYLQKTLNLSEISDKMFQSISFGSVQKLMSIKEKIKDLKK